MKNSFKELRRIAFVTLIIIVACGGYSCSPRSNWVSDRPKNFPDIIVVPPNAYNTHYLIKENKEGVTGDATLLCTIKEPYPAKPVIDFLENSVKEKGWIQLKHDPLNLHGTLTRPLNEWEYVEAIGNLKINQHELQEYWVDPRNNYSVNFALTYTFPVGDPENKMELTVGIAYFGPKALRQRKLIEHYRTMYPQEFDSNQQRTTDKEQQDSSPPSSAVTEPNLVSQRPLDFPGIVISPPNAYNIRYEIFENKDGFGSDASMVWSEKEPYPAKKLVDFLENHFKEKGWIQLKHDPTNLYHCGGDFKPLNSPNKWEFIEKTEKKTNQYQLSECWIDPINNNSVTIALFYVFPIGSPENKTALSCWIVYYGKKSLHQHEIIERYRTVYPEEFDPNQQRITDKE